MNTEIIREVPLSLTREGLFRRMGYGGRKRPPAPDILKQFQRAMDMVEVQSLLTGRYALWIGEISSVTREGTTTRCGRMIPGNRIFRLMPEASHLVLGLCTLGPELETLSRKMMRGEDPLLSVMLDSIGSAAVDSLVEEVSRVVSLQAQKKGLTAGSPISPGMPGLGLEVQSLLFEVLPTRELGMQLTHRQLMVPFKSSSMVWGLGRKMPSWSKEKVCKACHLYRHCRYKITGKHHGKSKE